MALIVAVVFGFDHCHPMASCAHMATAKVRKAEMAQANVARLARA
jgi:hypothetical protein